MLAIPRPKTRGDCLDEARPCPWVGCDFHLLLEVPRPLRRQDGPSRAPGLVLNLPTTGGQRQHLRPSCDADSFEVWSNDVVDALAAMPWSCSLDVADRLHALTVEQVGELLGLRESQARKASAAALRSWAAGMLADSGVEVPVRLPAIKDLAAHLKAALSS